MWNRRFQTPVNEVYGANETANGELGFYLVADGGGVAYRARTRPPSFCCIHFACFPHMIEGLPDIRDVPGGAGEFEHHCRRTGSMTRTLMPALSRTT